MSSSTHTANHNRKAIETNHQWFFKRFRGMDSSSIEFKTIVQLWFLDFYVVEYVHGMDHEVRIFIHTRIYSSLFLPVSIINFSVLFFFFSSFHSYGVLWLLCLMFFVWLVYILIRAILEPWFQTSTNNFRPNTTAFSIN